jgi:hypothetical protein
MDPPARSILNSEVAPVRDERVRLIRIRGIHAGGVQCASCNGPIDALVRGRLGARLTGNGLDPDRAHHSRSATRSLSRCVATPLSCQTAPQSSGIRRNSILKCLGRRSGEPTPRNPFVGDWRRITGRGSHSKVGRHRRQCVNSIAGLLVPGPPAVATGAPSR